MHVEFKATVIEVGDDVDVDGRPISTVVLRLDGAIPDLLRMAVSDDVARYLGGALYVEGGVSVMLARTT